MNGNKSLRCHNCLQPNVIQLVFYFDLAMLGIGHFRLSTLPTLYFTVMHWQQSTSSGQHIWFDIRYGITSRL